MRVSLLQVLHLLCWTIMLFSANLNAVDKKAFRVGVIGREAKDFVFQSALMGMRDAAAQLGPSNRIKIDVVLVSANETVSDPVERQAAALRSVTNGGFDAVIVDCFESEKISEAINLVVASGVMVVTVIHDVPRSRRFGSIGADQQSCGRLAMKKLAEEMNFEGRLAILAGDRESTHSQQRLKGAMEVIKQHKEIEVVGTYFHGETAKGAFASLKTAIENDYHDDIAAWLLLGNWPLSGPRGLPWQWEKERKRKHCISIGALPSLVAYIKSNDIDGVVTYDYHLTGFRCIEMVVDQLHLHLKHDADFSRIDESFVDASNYEEFMKNMAMWLR